jgi:DNA-binding CsgD family transcriptional regulator
VETIANGPNGVLSNGQLIATQLGKPALTRRETEVLHLMADGLTTKAIAARLGVTFKTAACHRGRILQKLSVDSTVSAVRWAIRVGIVEP